MSESMRPNQMILASLAAALPVLPETRFRVEIDLSYRKHSSPPCSTRNSKWSPLLPHLFAQSNRGVRRD